MLDVSLASTPVLKSLRQQWTPDAGRPTIFCQSLPSLLCRHAGASHVNPCCALSCPRARPILARTCRCPRPASRLSLPRHPPRAVLRPSSCSFLDPALSSFHEYNGGSGHQCGLDVRLLQIAHMRCRHAHRLGAMFIGVLVSGSCVAILSSFVVATLSFRTLP
jgi:hypothetical protein